MTNPARTHAEEEIEVYDEDLDEDRDCDECGGEGEIVLCIDDLCYRREQCIHGDPPDPCPSCRGTGRAS